MESPKSRPQMASILLLLLLLVFPSVLVRRALANGVTAEEAKQLRDEVKIESQFHILLRISKP